MIPAGEMWNRRFAEHGWPTEPDPLLVRLVKDLYVGRALDLGSGPGRNSLWLAARGWETTALDASEVALEQALQRAREKGLALHTVHADAEVWSAASEEFDLIVVANLHPGPSSLAVILRETAKALLPGGYLFVVGHDISNLGRHGPPDPERLLTVERLATAMPQGLIIHHLESTERRPDHGEGTSESDIAIWAWAQKPAE